VDYIYELEVSQNNNETISITDEILPALEISFANALLVELFPAACNILSLSTAVEGIVGLSTLEVDVLRNGTICNNNDEDKATTSNTTTCYVVDGSVTVYWDELVSQDLTPAIQQILESCMTSGEFAQSHEGIVRVGMYDGGTTPTSTTTTNTTLEQSSGLLDFLAPAFQPIIDFANSSEPARKLVIFSPFIWLVLCMSCCCFCFKGDGDSYENSKKGGTKTRGLKGKKEDKEEYDDDDDFYDDEEAGSSYSEDD